MEYPHYVGNGRCHGSGYNTAECDFDGGDCIDFNKKYPKCDVEYPYQVGDGHCHSGKYNTTECNFDGGDCIVPPGYPNCHVKLPKWVGNGWCDGGEYNTPECGFDVVATVLFQDIRTATCNGQLRLEMVGATVANTTRSSVALMVGTASGRML